MKRLVLSTVCMLFCATGMWAQTLVDGIYYRFDTSSKTASVSSQGYDSHSYYGSITIPSTVTYNGTTYKVTTIGASAFYYCRDLISVTIPNSVKSIDVSAFSGCEALESIEIPNSVTSIGGSAFSNCTGLTSVTIPNSVTTIESSAFSGCSGLTSVTIPNSVTSIGSSAFSNCRGLKSITIPNSVTSIGYGAFYNVKHIIYTGSATGSPWNAISVNGFVDGDFVFSDNTKTRLTAYIGDGGDVTIPSSVTTIGNSAFYSCKRLTSVTIGKSVATIGEKAFEQCVELKEIINESDLNITKGSVDNGYVAYYADYVCNGGKTMIGDFIFSDRDKALVKYTGNGGDVTLPENFNGDNYSISGAFYDCRGLTSITIPNSVTSIGERAFYRCKRLTSVTIPNSVTSIGERAFYNCRGLTSVTIGKSVATIGEKAFEQCVELKEIINESDLNITKGSADNGYVAYYADYVCNGGKTMIGDFIFSDRDKALVKYTGNGGDVTLPEDFNGDNYSISGAFSGCRGLTSVTIPNSVTSIGGGAFSGCSGLTSITIPNSVTSIGERAFSSCIGLTSVTIPNSVTSIGERAFYYCRGLTSVTIPNSVTSIGSLAFCNCSGLTSITIPNSVTSIGERAFSSCSGLTSVTIGTDVTSIGERAFSDCSGLTSINVASGNSVYDSRSNCNAIIETASNTLIAGCQNTIIPNSVASIGDYAFYDCIGLTNVTIPNSVTSIGDYAFYDCSGLTSITIPNGVTSIGSLAFYNCSGLTSITIPNSVTSIGSSAFYKVKHIIYTGSATGSPWGAIAVNGFVDGDFVFSDDTKTLLTAYIGNGGDITIPNSVTSIGDYAFDGCSGLTSVTIPNSVTSIGNGAFDGCSELTSVTIPNSVASIGDYAFYDCSGLTSITIPNSVTSIEGYTFYNCSGLTSITIPNSVTTIEGYTFSGCTGLTSVTIPNSVTSIRWRAFAWCSALTNIEIPNSVTSIEDYAFQGCTGLTSITIPNSVTSIGYDAFDGCSGLTSIIVPCEKYDYFVGKFTGYATIIYGDCTFEVAVNANNENYGTVTGSGVFKMGQTIQLTATANEGYRFKGWSDGVMDASREITVTKDTSITANFVTLYTIKALASASQGTVSGGGLYEIGETATLVANAKTGYTFAQWVDGNDENPRTVTVNGNKTYTAIFAIDEHNVTLNKNITAAGTVTGDGVYEHNTTVQLTATANEGYRFKGWSDGVTDASREIIVTKDTIITANFVALYTIKALASASQGTVIGGGVYEDGETVTLVANPNPGYIFAQWVDGSDENPRNVTVNGNKTYTAYFIEGESDAATAAPEAEESIVETARYDINGRPLNAPTKGVNIVKYSDGSFEKEFVR